MYIITKRLDGLIQQSLHLLLGEAIIRKVLWIPSRRIVLLHVVVVLIPLVIVNVVVVGLVVGALHVRVVLHVLKLGVHRVDTGSSTGATRTRRNAIRTFLELLDYGCGANVGRSALTLHFQTK